MGQPDRVEYRSCLIQRDHIRFDHRNIADWIDRINSADPDPDQAFAGRVTEPYLAGIGVNILCQPANGDGTLAVISQPIPARQKGRSGGLVGQNERLDPFRPIGDFQGPAIGVKVSAGLDLFGIDPTPLPRQMPDPRPGSFHQVNERLFG